MSQSARHNPLLSTDAAFVNARLDQQIPHRVDTGLEHLSDLEIAKASKAAADRAARDEAVRTSSNSPCLCALFP